MTYYLYLLRCADETLYCGITTSLTRRVAEHNTSEKGAKYTRSRRPVELVYQHSFKNRSAATRAEGRMKKLSRVEKLALVAAARSRKSGH